MSGHTLTIAEIQSVVTGPINGLFIHNAAEHRARAATGIRIPVGIACCSGKSGGQRTRFADDGWISARVCSQNSDRWIDVDGLVFVEAKSVHVLHFDN